MTSDTGPRGPSRPLRVLGIAGSLRRGSFNRALLRAAIELAPDGMRIAEYQGLGDLPHYDQDIDTEDPPSTVRALREAVRDCDALLVVTPEYNYGVPGVLKNAIDWASRPAATSALRGKPAAVMGATTGMSGTARAQLQLRQAFVFTQTFVTPGPEVLVANARDRFDAELRLIHEPTRDVIRRHLERLADFTRRLNPEP